MDFDSPDVMKDFPGLYASEFNKKCSNDNSDDNEKITKKDASNKRKEKKDKDKGYAALEGESSDDNCKSKSPSKSKKSKSFKFATKAKEKRDKSREKETADRKKDRDKKLDKKNEKEKGKIEKIKKLKQSTDEYVDVADVLPVFGVSLEDAVERNRCHDGVDIPLPVRACLDSIETAGMSFENVYKISGTKSKVLQIKKMYNQHETVYLSDYDVPTVTSLLKAFLRDLPEPIFTNDLLIRFEEAGAILNANTREKHLRILVDNLPQLNKLLLSWLITHFDNVSYNEKLNKMNKQNLATALNHTFHCSSRLLNALLQHSHALFPNVVIEPYIPPLGSGGQLPDEPNLIEIELKKQESLLNQIHKEISVGCISKQREELLWEVQRIITQLKRKLKTANKDKEVPPLEEKINVEEIVEKPPEIHEAPTPEVNECSSSNNAKEDVIVDDKEKPAIESEHLISNEALMLLQLKNEGLRKLKDNLFKVIQAERKDIKLLKGQIISEKPQPIIIPDENLDEVMNLLLKENQILQIKKINLVRQIVEQQEMCIELKAKLMSHM